MRLHDDQTCGGGRGGHKTHAHFKRQHPDSIEAGGDGLEFVEGGEIEFVEGGPIAPVEGA
jgi:hypothetical protein